MDHPETDSDAKLRALDDAIHALKGDEKAPTAKATITAERQAMRMVSDFVAACLVSAGLGYGLDQWLGTTPWMLVGGIFVGAGVGTKLLLDAEARDKRHAAKSAPTPAQAEQNNPAQADITNTAQADENE
jgi:ATP synthase protein I